MAISGIEFGSYAVPTIRPDAPASGPAKAESTSQLFREALIDAGTRLVEAHEASGQEVSKVAEGKAEDIHDTLISMEKANIELRYAVSVRNRVLEAYREVMKMGS